MAYELAFLFFARMADMSAATVRHILVIRGRRVSAAFVGFVEIVIYLLALGLMLQQPHSALRIAVFGLGFAMGIYLGSLIEEKLAIGLRLLQVTVDGHDTALVAALRARGCPVTTWRGEGLAGEKRILQVLLPRRRAAKMLAEIRAIAPEAFVIALEPNSFLGGLGPALAMPLPAAIFGEDAAPPQQPAASP